MNSHDVFLIYIPFNDGSGGKTRPAIAIRVRSRGSFLILPITSKYENKSKAIKKRYYEIKDLDSARLNKKSWVDTGNRFELKSNFNPYRVIGHFSEEDIIGLSKMI